MSRDGYGVTRTDGETAVFVIAWIFMGVAAVSGLCVLGVGLLVMMR